MKVIKLNSWKTALLKLQVGLTETQSEMLFNFLDQDKDGILTPTDFLEFNEERKKNTLNLVGSSSKLETMRILMHYLSGKILKQFRTLREAFDSIREKHE